MKKKLLLTSVHPAPYIDTIINSLESVYEVVPIYDVRKSNEKAWALEDNKSQLFVKEVSFLKIIKIVQSVNLLIVGGWGSITNILLILLSKRIFKKPVCVFSDCPIDNKRNFYYYFKKYILFTQIDYLFCATESTIQYYNKEYKIDLSKLIFFPYAVDFPDEIKPTNDILNSNTKPNIFISNNFIERKGYHILYKAFEILDQRGLLNQYTISIAGNGLLKNDYEILFEKLSVKINFYGWISYDSYINHLNSCDVFIHASIFEPFGIPPLDAMARHKVIIVSDGVQSTKDMIVNGVNGFSYAADDFLLLSECIMSLSKYNFEKIGKSAAISVYEKYSNSIYLKVLNEISIKVNF
nr:glycosyltransferase family 4 protein [uncultured Flavobacterium sp.]